MLHLVSQCVGMGNVQFRGKDGGGGGGGISDSPSVF